MPGEYYFYIEINKAFDTNDSYTTGNGQPSVIWRGSITVGAENSSASASISGHGHETGNDGTIYTDVSLMTTALVYVSNLGLTDTAPTTGKVAAPAFAPASGTYSTPQDVTLSCTTGGATITPNAPQATVTPTTVPE